MAWFSRGSSDGCHAKEQKRREKAAQEWQAGRAGRVKAHRSRGIRKAADAGEAWERKQRNFG
jgi:hypothetical protein